MSLPDAHTWINALTKNPDHQRKAIIGAGSLGDPSSIPWLIEMMEIPELARVAGESLSIITGLDLAYEDL